MLIRAVAYHLLNTNNVKYSIISHAQHDQKTLTRGHTDHFNKRNSTNDQKYVAL